jgi:hypothetical protein
VERFFVNWTLHPSNHGASLGKPARVLDRHTPRFSELVLIGVGHMHDLPVLFFDTEPHSVLWLAVRAVAFADIRNESSGTIPFHIKARQHYGAALNRMRTVITDQDNLDDDRVLSAMLLIDNFEVTRDCHHYLNT